MVKTNRHALAWRPGTDSRQLSMLRARADQRSKEGSLKSSLIKPYTRKIYWEALLWFFAYMDHFLVELPTDHRELDPLVQEAIELAWHQGEARALVGNLLSGLEHFIPSFRSNLKGSWRLWKQWGKRELVSRAPPVDPRTVLALCYYMHTWGHPEAAVVTLLAFHRFLRPMDYLHVKVSQFLLGKSTKKAHLMLSHTKTGGVNSVPIDDPKLIFLLRQHCALKRSTDHFMPITGIEYRRLFAAAVAAVGLPADYKPYSLRRGGASAYFQITGQYDKVMELGNWKHLTTCKIYVNTALYELTQAQLLRTDTILSAATAFIRILG